MKTAIDSSVLFDILLAGPFGLASTDALRLALQRGTVVACDIVWAEIAAQYDSAEAVRQVFGDLSVTFDPMGAPSAAAAGRAWWGYRRAGGSRERMVADFMVAAHALEQTDGLLTRDRGFHRRYFPELVVMDPASA